MQYAIDKLKADELVLMKKIKGLQDGKPKWRASEQLDEIRMAIKLLERYRDMSAEDAEEEEEYLSELFSEHPPKAQA